MSKTKFSSFAVTFRPSNGVTDEDVDKFCTWCRKTCKYYRIITEKLNHERHIHAALFLTSPQVHSNVSLTLVRLFKRLDSTEQRVFRTGIKPMYNIDWADKYLDKDDDTVLVADNLPEAFHLEAYFPVTYGATAGRPTSSPNKYYVHLRTLWYEHNTDQREVNTVNVRHFLFKMMYGLDLIKILRDDKTIIQTAKHLVRFIKQADECTFDLPQFEVEE